VVYVICAEKSIFAFVVALFIIGYLLFNVLIGIYAARRVKTDQDFILAGRRLSLPLAAATVFATWFGSETVLGASSRFAEEGGSGLVEDPLGAALCLVLVGFFFARPLYRMNLSTFGDFYRIRFGKTAELISGAVLVISYVGWVSAQMVAMGLVLHTVLPEISVTTGILLSTAVVVAYTMSGGMWSVSITDFVQTIFIVAGLIAATLVVVHKAGGMDMVLQSAPENSFDILPDKSFPGVLEFVAAWISIGLGSIPQQDVFQRVMSSKSEKVAVRSSFLAAGMYLTIAFLPVVMVLAAKLLIATPADVQLTLPTLIMQQTGPVLQIFFFGALLSAVMSTASGALLAPAVILSENILQPLFPQHTDRVRLLRTRLCVAALALVAVGMAVLRRDIAELVSEASAISLVGLFVPLCCGLFLRSTNSIAAIASMLAGMGVWLAFTFFPNNCPAMIWGISASAFGWIVVVFIQRLKSVNRQ
jgi:SSS family solute:Na+ symporter